MNAYNLTMQPPPIEPHTRVSAWIVAVAMLLMAVIAVIVFYNVQVTRARANEGNSDARTEREIEVRAANLGQALIAQQNDMRGYLLSRRAADLDAYFLAKASAEKQVRTLDALIPANSRHQPEYFRARAESAAIESIVARAVQAARTSGAEMARTQSAEAPAMQAAQGSVRALQESAGEIAAHIERDVNRARTRVDRELSYLALLFVLTIIFTLFWVYSERSALQRVAHRLREANGVIDGARRRAEEADAAKSRFLALASHDMRQPLHAITLYLASLRRRVENEQAKDIVERMDMAAQSLTHMFSGLLDLARIESGVLRSKPRVFPLQEAFDAVMRDAAEVSPSTKADLRVVSTSVTVQSDPELLESILRNLLTNAFKYAPGGRVLLGCRRDGARVRVEVRDEGPGIPKDKLIMVFGEFVRLDAAKGGAIDGLGLGLSIAARLTRLLGSSLEVSSEPGKGACFFFTLPLARPIANAASASAASPSPELSGLNIAVKDDEPLALAAMTAVLRDAGAEVRSFGASAEYVEAVANGATFDLVIGDPVLLRESAATFARTPGRVRPPVILLTGATDGPTLAALDASNTPFLIKPVSEEALLSAAAQVARRRLAQSAG